MSQSSYSHALREALTTTIVRDSTLVLQPSLFLSLLRLLFKAQDVLPVQLKLSLGSPNHCFTDNHLTLTHSGLCTVSIICIDCYRQDLICGYQLELRACGTGVVLVWSSCGGALGATERLGSRHRQVSSTSGVVHCSLPHYCGNNVWCGTTLLVWYSATLV